MDQLDPSKVGTNTDLYHYTGAKTADPQISHWLAGLSEEALKKLAADPQEQVNREQLINMSLTETSNNTNPPEKHSDFAEDYSFMGEMQKQKASSRLQAKAEPNALIKFLDGDLARQKISFYCNMFSSITNTAAAVINLLPMNKKFQDTALKFASFATKSSIAVFSGIAAAIKLFREKNLLGVFGYGMNFYNILHYCQDKLFAKNGIPSGINFTDFGSQAYSRKKNYDSFGEHLKTTLPNIKKALLEISPWHHTPSEGSVLNRAGNYIKNVVNNLRDKKSGSFIIINGLAMVLGTVMSNFKPFELIGQTIRHLAGTLPDFDRMKNPVEQPNNFRSGIFYLFSTAINYLKYLIQHVAPEAGDRLARVVTPLVFAANDWGRYFHFRADNLGEKVQKNGQHTEQKSNNENFFTQIIQSVLPNERSPANSIAAAH